jgi:uncharacterized membrane protein
VGSRLLEELGLGMGERSNPESRTTTMKHELKQIALLIAILCLISLHIWSENKPPPGLVLIAMMILTLTFKEEDEQ